MFRRRIRKKRKIEKISVRLKVATKKVKGLGKSLGSMFGVKDVADALAPSQVGKETPKLPLSKLKPGKYQTRKTMHDESIQELADSIKEKGILNPIVVRKVGNNYEILAGERRFRAATLLGLAEVPVTILQATDEEALAIGLIENLQREDLNIVETALGLHRLIEEFGYRHEDVAASVGRSRSAVTNILRLLTLPDKVLDLLRNEALDMGHARALLALPKDKQVEIAELVVEKGLSVRQTEALVNRIKDQEEKAPREATKSKDIQLYEEELSDLLGLAVKLTANAKGKGRLSISFANQDEFESILQRLRS